MCWRMSLSLVFGVGRYEFGDEKMFCVFFFACDLVLVCVIHELFVGFVDKRSEIVAKVSTWCVQCEA